MQVSSLTGSATSIIANAQQRANTAAQTIANLSVQSGEVGGSKGCFRRRFIQADSQFESRRK